MRFEPRYAWVSLLWWSAGGAALSAILIVAVFATIPAPQWPVWGLQGALVSTAIVLGTFAPGIGRKRLRRRLIAADSQLCTRCAYDLRGTPEPGPCPECGRFFSIEGVQWEWRKFVNPQSDAGDRIWRWWWGEKGP